METNIILKGDCIEEMKKLPDNSVDAIITDPPYGLGFMGKEWDTFDKSQFGIAGEEGENDLKVKKNFKMLPRIAEGKELQEFTLKWAKECFRVLKPGGHLLSFGGTRTYHRMACAIEDAGFEVRDMIEWVYGSGFPKSLNIGKAIDKLQGNEREVVGVNPNARDGGGNVQIIQKKKDEILTKGNTEWEGWGTALKPSHEPIVMARKPLSEKTVAENVLKYGTGGINIDESRVEAQGKDLDKLNSEWDREWNTNYSDYADKVGGSAGFNMDKAKKENAGLTGRFPANLIHDGSEEVLREFEKAGISKSSDNKWEGENNANIYGKYQKGVRQSTFSDSGTPARFFKQCEFTEEDFEYSPFFYCAKASRSERNRGMDDIEAKEWKQENSPNPNREERPFLPVKNNHPTVKPIALMEYLIKMVTPKDGIVLDPFAGSGTTLIACKMNGFKFIGIEKTEEYVRLTEKRLKETNSQTKLNLEEDVSIPPNPKGIGYP